MIVINVALNSNGFGDGEGSRQFGSSRSTQSATTDDIKARQKWDPCYTCSCIAYIHGHIYIYMYANAICLLSNAEETALIFVRGLSAALRAALAQNL